MIGGEGISPPLRQIVNRGSDLMKGPIMAKETIKASGGATVSLADLFKAPAPKKDDK